jgi:hypothetical protein
LTKVINKSNVYLLRLRKGEREMNEKIKNHLKKRTSMTESQIEKALEDVKFFDYLKQPAKIADAIIATR